MALPKSHSWSVATPGLGREPLSCRPVDAGAGVAELGCEPQQDSRGEGLRQRRLASLPASSPTARLQTCLLLSLSQAGGRPLCCSLQVPRADRPEGFTLNRQSVQHSERLQGRRGAGASLGQAEAGWRPGTPGLHGRLHRLCLGSASAAVRGMKRPGNEGHSAGLAPPGAQRVVGFKREAAAASRGRQRVTLQRCDSPRLPLCPLQARTQHPNTLLKSTH